MPSLTNALYLLAILSLLIALSEWLCRRGWFRHVGSALMVIISGAIVSNLGLIPTGSTEAAPVPVYDTIFAVVAPIALFYLLLSVNLRSVLQAGLPLIALFLAGSAGTVLGAVLAMRLIDGAALIGPLHGAIAGMFTGTYTGGGVNFNAVALEYGVMRSPSLYGGAVVVDNVITAVWIAATLGAPRALAGLWPLTDTLSTLTPAAPIIDLAAESETLDPRRFAMVLVAGAGAYVISSWLTRTLAAHGYNVPSILIITTLALVLAQIPATTALRGARVLGMYGVYLFLAVVGAFCDVRALAQLGRLGLVLFAFASILVLVHGLVTFGVARAFRMDLAAAAVASQANIGGSTSALALAKSLGREDLLVPGILLGSLGNALGTFLGFLVVPLA